ncbi:MAG: hypothetical protein LBB14_02775, partial [Puniceicoccales bacterium]|nr:hypothetical protein [Puniceicoccales bacterium]
CLRGKAFHLRCSVSCEPTSRDRLEGSLRYDVHRQKLISQRYRYLHHFDRNWSLDMRLNLRHGFVGRKDRHLFRISMRLSY